MTAPKYLTATEDIYVARGVRAHVKGDAVPAENVKANGWEDLVEKPKAESSSPASKGSAASA